MKRISCAGLDDAVPHSVSSCLFRLSARIRVRVEHNIPPKEIADSPFSTRDIFCPADMMLSVVRGGPVPGLRPTPYSRQANRHPAIQGICNFSNPSLLLPDERHNSHQTARISGSFLLFVPPFSKGLATAIGIEGNWKYRARCLHLRAEDGR